MKVLNRKVLIQDREDLHAGHERLSDEGGEIKVLLNS